MLIHAVEFCEMCNGRYMADDRRVPEECDSYDGRWSLVARRVCVRSARCLSLYPLLALATSLVTQPRRPAVR